MKIRCKYGKSVVICCKVCGKQFKAEPNVLKKGGGKYCSRACYRIIQGIRTGYKNPKWKGGKYITKRGYVNIYSPHHPFHNKAFYVFEHRLVMEKHLGRYLAPTEIVHHINHIKTDNRIENLMLIKSASEHAKLFHGFTKRKK